MSNSDESLLKSLWNKAKALKYEYLDGLNEADAQNKAEHGMTKVEATQRLKTWVENNDMVWVSGNREELIEDFKGLVSAGANVNVVGDDGRTALMNLCVAVPRMDEAELVVKDLLKCGADVDKQDKKYGKTPLMYSMQGINELGGNEAVVTELLKYHPDLTIQDAHGKTVMDYAKSGIENSKELDDVESLARYEKIYSLLKEEEKWQLQHNLHNQKAMSKSSEYTSEANNKIDARIKAKKTSKTQAPQKKNLQSKSFSTNVERGR